MIKDQKFCARSSIAQAYGIVQSSLRRNVEPLVVPKVAPATAAEPLAQGGA